MTVRTIRDRVDQWSLEQDAATAVESDPLVLSREFTGHYYNPALHRPVWFTPPLRGRERMLGFVEREDPQPVGEAFWNDDIPGHPDRIDTKGDAAA